MEKSLDEHRIGVNISLPHHVHVTAKRLAKANEMPLKTWCSLAVAQFSLQEIGKYKDANQYVEAAKTYYHAKLMNYFITDSSFQKGDTTIEIPVDRLHQFVSDFVDDCIAR